MSESKALCISNTVDFFPTTCADPTMTAAEQLSMIMTDLLDVLKAHPILSPIFNSQQDLATAITTVQSILGRDYTTPTVPPPQPSGTTLTAPVITNTNARSTRSKPINLYPKVLLFLSTIQIHYHFTKVKSPHSMPPITFTTSNTSRVIKENNDKVRKYRKPTQKYNNKIQHRTILHGIKKIG